MRPLVTLPKARFGSRGGRDRGGLGGHWGAGLAGLAKAKKVLNLVGRYPGRGELVV